MESKDKWLMFKNYMHNELGVDKDTIRSWIQEAVTEEARKLIQNTYDNTSLKQVIINAYSQAFKYEYNNYDAIIGLKNDVTNCIADKIIKEIKNNR